MLCLHRVSGIASAGLQDIMVVWKHSSYVAQPTRGELQVV